MESLDSKSVDSSQSVRVAVNIRPLITAEHLVGCTDCITVVHGEPQVVIGSHTFTYDYVYGNTRSAPSTIYEDCVAPLIDALFNGYNATVLAYGQTGSGKTYTMGTNYNGDDINGGIIPKVMDDIYKRVEATRNSVEFLIRVSFIEIFKEEVFDLLDSNGSAITKGEGALGKPFVPIRAPIQIRETINGGITLAGVTEPEVRTKEEMALYLSRGSSSRATGSTNMNSQSSRSHAIFTITMEQKKIVGGLSGVSHDDTSDDILCSKLHLVDLAGSERAKRTGADGMRLKEGIHINKGLLALGNVISALGDEKKRKEGGHVPYRDSKLTRLLQDSLGGNSKTVMIACVSPADTNAEETLNTLKYANRARNIQNKAIVNRDPTTSQIQRMKSQIEQLQSELLFYRGDLGAPYEELQILKHKISLLEASNEELKKEVLERQITCKHLSQRAMDAQVEKDKMMMKIENSRNGKSWDEIDSTSEKDYDLVQNYVSKIQELEAELLHSKNTNGSTNRFHDCMDTEKDKRDCKNVLFPPGDYASDFQPKSGDFSDEIEDHEKELEHSSLQEKFDKELKELDKKLEMKEAEMKRVGGGDPLVLKQHYEKKVQELEIEKRTLQREIEVLTCNLANISSTSDDGAQKLKEEYLQKLNVLEAQVSELKKKQDAQSQLLRQKQKSDEVARKLQDEIQRIKSQKVQLQHKIKQESEQFRLWKASREKEVLQLKKEGRRNEYEMHKLLALNQRQKMVLQRKTEEAAQATRRLKDLLESRKASSRETSNFRNGNGSGLQALMQEIEHELEVTVHVHEVRSEYERQMEERGRMAKEAALLKENSQSAQSMSPGARNSRVFALENMLATSSSTLVSMAAQLSEAEDRDRLFSGKGRWNQVRSLPDAKNIMNFLFNLASSSRCTLRDKEVSCREQESEIRELKQKIFNLNSAQRKLEIHNAELINQNLTLKNRIMNNSMDPPKNGGLNNYDSHKQEIRSSVILLEDMDTSESECSDNDDTTDDEWVNSAKQQVDSTDDEWVDSLKQQVVRKNSKNNRGRSSMAPSSRDNPSLNPALDGFGEGISSPNDVTVSGLCCSCSKFSLCKTIKCPCRVNGGYCGSSCGCKLSRCTNRDGKNKQDVQSRMMEVEENGNGFEIDGTNRNQGLASQGATLLQSALTNEPIEARRKALSDIGNTQAKSNIPNPNHRKKWRKSTIQLVTDNSTPMQPSNSEAIQSQKPENSTREVNIPLKLPRALRSASSNGGGLLREKNVSQSDEQVGSKDGAALVPPASSVRQKKASDEKENFGI